MMEINNNGTIIKVYPSDESELTTGVMTSGKVVLHFRSDQDIKLEQGATIEFLGNTYTLVYPQETKKLWRGYLEYIATFYSSAEQLKHKLLKDPSNIARTSFVFAGSPTDFATLVARSMGHEWSVGNCVATSYDKTIAFKEESCWAALGRVAEEFHTEWVIEGKSISLRKDERYKEDPLPLSYGKGNGFLSGVSQRGNADNLPISRLYVLGSSRNIDPTKYGASTLHLPKSWSSERMRTDEAGNYIELLEGNGAEGSMELSELYPHRVGVVSSVVVANEAKHFYDVIDTSIPDELNYNDYRIRGEKAILKFETGALAGRQFEIRQSETALSGYHHQERRFELIPSEQDGFIMPSKEWAPKAGDRYAIFGIALPQEYVTLAENELLKEAIRTLSERSLPQFTFEGEVDGIWAKQKWLEIGGKLVPGGHVLFSDPEFHPEGTVIRITSMAQKVNNPTAPSITLSTALVGGSLWNVINRAEAQEVLSQKRDRELQRSQRQSYEQALEHIGMVERAVEGVEGFSKRIKPSVIETMGLLVGSQATQLDFVERYGSLKSVPMAINYNPSDKRITISNAFIRHQTIGITSITNARKPTDYRYWSVARYTSPALTDTEQSYYIYAKVEREGKGGNYLLSPDPLTFETTTHYHLLIGTLSSVIDGDRAYNRLYGFSMVTPGQILTDTISSANGNMTIDLQNGSIISDQIEFRRPDGSKKSVEEVITDTVQVGGRNLLRNKDIIATIANQISVEYEQVQPKEGRNTYTLSFEYWIDENDTATSRRISLQGVGLWIERVIADSKWHRFEHTIQLTLDESKYPLKGWLTDYSSRGNRVPGMAKVRNIKLERGTVATDWSPAPEDVQADIEAVERGYQKLIERVDVEFAISNSRDTAPTSGWQTNAPTPARGQALWQRTKVYLKDGTTEVRGVTCIQGKDGLDGKDGAKGGDGADGRGITKIVELYYLSSSNTALGNGAWSETAPTPKEGFWIWTKTRIHYTTGEQIDTQPICVTGNKGDKGDRGERGLQGLQGKDGTEGLPGRDGVDGKTSYTHIAYADTATGGGFSQSPAGKAYIGMYVDFVQTDSTNPKKYAWSLIKGADGKNGLNGKDGVPGKPGADGRTPYLHIAYANSQDGTQGFSVSVSEGKSYIGTYTDYTQADSTDPTKYSWSKIKGEDGLQVRENLWTWLQYSLGQNDRYGCRLTPLPDRKFKIEKVEASKYSFGGASYYTHPIKNPPGRYTISFKVVECSRPIRFYYDTGIDKKEGDLVGDFYYYTMVSSSGRLPAFAFTWGKAGTDDQAKIGDYAIIKDIKIERVEEGEDPRPTAYIPHPDDLKGEKGDRGERGLQGLQGKDGTNGLPGRDGVDGKTSYTHIAYADTTTGGGFSQSPTGKAYIGMYVDFVQEDSSDPKKYAWSLIKGADGKNGLNGKDGVPGKPGADGRTPYLHIAYANSQDGKQGFSVSVSEGKSYIGTYTDYTQTDSTDPTRYSWSKIKGEDAVVSREVPIDATGLDENMYYPIAITGTPYVVQNRYRVYTRLYYSGKPSWATHSRGFQCELIWKCYNSSWGGFDVNMQVEVASYKFVNNVPPISQPSQMVEYSVNYTYVRGGGKYYVELQAREQATLDDIKVELVTAKKSYGSDPYIRYLEPQTSITAPITDLDKEAQARATAVKEVNAGLSNANTLIATLEKTAKELKEGKLDTKDLPDLQYLLNALQKGDTKIAGGLLLTNSIILSEPTTGQVMATISGTANTGANALRLGIQYPDSVALATLLDNGKVSFGSDVTTDEQREQSLLKQGYSVIYKLANIRNWIVRSTASTGELTTLRNDGTGHIGQLHFDSDRIVVAPIGDISKAFMEFGRNVMKQTIQEVLRSNAVDTSTTLTNVRVSDSQTVTRTFRVMNDNTSVTIDMDLVIDREVGERLYRQHPYPKQMIARLDDEKGLFAYNFQDWEEDVDIYDPSDGAVYYPAIQASTTSVHKTVILHQGTHTLTFYTNFGRGGANNIKVSQKYSTNYRQTSFSDRGMRIFGGGDSYVDFNHDHPQGTTFATIGGGLKVDYIDMPGVPLCGAMVKNTGAAYKSFGRYKNKSGTSQPQVSYNYSTKSFTVYHSIPHDKYIPLVNPFDDPASPVISDVSAYSFKVRFTLQQYRNDGWAVGFSYVAFQAE